MNDEIILVNEKDEPVGYGSKEDIHRTGDLHRAFSVFLYNGRKLLIQQRADHKYHSPGLWANTCCSHPRKGEKTDDAVKRRLMEEAGIECEAHEIFSFLYKCQFNENLYEHEYDHVYLGKYDGTYEINPDEVKAFRWIDISELQIDIENHPEKYAYWFKLAVPKVIKIIEEKG